MNETDAERKYSNFKTLIKSIPGVNSVYATVIDQINLTTFLNGIYLEMEKCTSKPEMIQAVLCKTGIKLEDISEEVQTKIGRYVDYFMALALIVLKK